MRRLKTDQEYYVLPGGGIGAGESPEQAAIREAKEELGIDIEIQELLHVEEWNGRHYYFKAEMTGGTFGSGIGEEYNQPDPKKGVYQPIWTELEKLSLIDVRPSSITSTIHMNA